MSADVFGRGASAFGSLAAAMGVGSVAGALAVGRLGSRVSPRKVAWALVGIPLCWGVYKTLQTAVKLFR